jgi:bacillithiol biosynthesis deacetylase BshB1
VSLAVDVLVLGAHPDDAEIGCGGTLLGLVEQGFTVAIADLTRGEKGSRGTPEQRAQEAAAAAALLGVRERVQLGLPDTELRDDTAAARGVIEVIRRLRPRLLIAPVPHDAHPDHVAAGQLARRAFFHAGLTNVMPELGAGHRPRVFLQYLGNDLVQPTLCVDIGRFAARKRDVLRCYASQVGGPKTHLLRRVDVVERAEVRDRYFGVLVGCEAAEPFVCEGPLPLAGLGELLSADDSATGGKVRAGGRAASGGGAT